MTTKEFIFWLKGFTEGVHEFNVTPKQWDYLKEVLSEVSDEPQWQPEHGPNSPTIQNINKSLGESLEELENDFFGAIDDGGWTPELEEQFWSEQPIEPFATPEELAKYNIDSEGFGNQITSR
jgi:hypothetical protein